jgi:cyclophilin family peptidyl-prolyl cis-trans isomerase
MSRILKTCGLACLAWCLVGIALAEETKAPVPAKDGAAPSKAASGAKENPVVVIKTSKGDVEVELFEDEAPISVKNFLRYADEKFYDGTVFHRVISGFMIQGGGMTADLGKKETHEAIKNEADNGLKNTTGTLAMARTNVPDSATSQFFINTADNAALDHTGPGPRFGYAVFGKVVSGMDVVRAIEAVKTTTRAPHQNVPIEPVTIVSVKRK